MNSLAITLSFLLLVAVFVAQAAIDGRVKRMIRFPPSFDDRNRPNATWVISTTIELPCTVHNLEGHKVSWMKDGVVLTVGSNVAVSDRRVGIRYNADDSTWYLSIDPGRKADQGQYVCQVDTVPTMSSVFHLAMIEYHARRRWRVDARCGPNDIVQEQQAECNPDGPYPCCSSGGWCGFTALHCDCPTCVEYTKEIETTTEFDLSGCKVPFEPQANSDKCVVYAEEEMTWTEAQTYCQNLGAELFTFNSLDQLTKETMTILEHDTNGAKFWVHLTTEGRTNPVGVAGLIWRWVLGPQKEEFERHRQCSAVSRQYSTAFSHDEYCDALHLPLCHQTRDL